MAYLSKVAQVCEAVAVYLNAQHWAVPLAFRAEYLNLHFQRVEEQNQIQCFISPAGLTQEQETRKSWRVIYVVNFTFMRPLFTGNLAEEDEMLYLVEQLPMRIMDAPPFAGAVALSIEDDAQHTYFEDATYQEQDLFFAITHILFRDSVSL